MDIQTLKQRIESLLPKLQAIGAADPELRKQLEDLDRDIQALLAQSEEGAAVEATGLGARLRAISTRFANRHPRLEPVLDEVANLLASIGI